MINCDICGKDIRALHEAYHTIPVNDFNIVFCDDCYKGFKEHLTIDDILEGMNMEDKQ